MKKERFPGFPKKTVTVITFLSLFSILITPSFALTIELLSNTQNCTYVPEFNKDYCNSVYRVSDSLAVESRDITAIYKTDKTDFSDSVNRLLPDIRTEKSGLDIIVNISAYKYPLDDVDNVLCYKDYCEYKYAWWNGSYDFKNAINGTYTNVTNGDSILVNVSMLIDGSRELFYCNLTINTSSQTLGYVYWNDETDYICVDAQETEARATIITEGNGSDHLTPEKDLIGFYPLFGTAPSAGVGEDYSIYEYDGTNYGVVTNGVGHIGTSGYFTEDYIDLGDIASWDNIDHLTSCGWFRPEDTGDYHLVSKFDGSSTSNYAWFLNYEGSNTRYTFFVRTDANCQPVASGMGVQTSIWAFVCGTYDADAHRAKLYINGEHNATASCSGSNIQATSTKAAIGAEMRATPTSKFIGYIDEVFVWNRTLTPYEIRALYIASYGRFNVNDTENSSYVAPPTVTPNITLGVVQSYCIDQDYLYYVSKDIADNGTAVYNEYLEFCQYGCQNNTWYLLGYSGCAESPMLGFIVVVAILGFLVLISRWF